MPGDPKSKNRASMKYHHNLRYYVEGGILQADTRLTFPDQMNTSNIPLVAKDYFGVHLDQNVSSSRGILTAPSAHFATHKSLLEYLEGNWKAE